MTSALNPSDTKTFLSKKKRNWQTKSLKPKGTMALGSAMKAKMGARKSKTIKATMSLPKKMAKGGPAVINLGRKV